MEEKYKNVRSKVYNTRVENFSYPEDFLEEMQDKDSFGVCFSGGGTRSASLSMGQMRALNKIGVLQKAKYMSGVSGGSWATLPFIYLDENISDETFLEQYLEPEQITVENLKTVNENSLAWAIANSYIFKTPKGMVEYNKHDLYSKIISRIFLAPFNIGDSFKFFTYNDKSRDEIVSQNTEQGLTSDDFYTVNKRNNRPYYFAGGTLRNGINARYQVEMSPLYVGINPYYPANIFNWSDIGGGYVQPHGFNTKVPNGFDSATNWVHSELGSKEKIFNLGEIIGTSGAAPAIFDLFPPGMFPSYSYWCHFDNPISQKDKIYDFADGGIIENLGIMPLLRRKVKKIILFINCETPITVDKKGKIVVSDSIPALFHAIPNNYLQLDFKDNIVFANQEDKYNLLVNDLYNKVNNGEPAIHVNSYKVTPQEFYNITESYDVDIMWVYNSKSQEWYNQLSDNVKSFIESENDQFSNFPYYKTFFQNSDIIRLSPEQVNLEANLSAWILNSNEALIKNFLNNDVPIV